MTQAYVCMKISEYPPTPWAAGGNGPSVILTLAIDLSFFHLWQPF